MDDPLNGVVQELLDQLNAGFPRVENMTGPQARADTHEGLAPAVIVTAGSDPLHSEGCDSARRLRRAGVPVVHRDFPGLFQGSMTMQALPSATSAQHLVFGDLRELLHPADRSAVS